MRTVFWLIAVVPAVLGLTGCGGMAPLRIAADKDAALSPVVFDGSDGVPGDASVCLIGWSGGYIEGVLDVPKAGYRPLPKEEYAAERCEALAKIRRTGVTVYATSFVDVYSPFGGGQVARMEAEGAFGPILGYQRIGRYLQQELAYASPLRKKLDEAKAAHPRVGPEQLAALAGADALTWDILMNAAVGSEAKAEVLKLRARGWPPPEPDAREESLARSPRPPAIAVATDLDELPAAAPLRPRSYAIVIGVEHYREKLPNADYAEADAKLTARYFERALGLPEENMAVLVDDRAAKSDFEKYFERWLPNRVEAGDTVYVYFSGHGAPNPTKGDAYLVPYDGDPTYIDQTGFAVKRMLDDLAKLPAKQVYVAMDSCFSGAGGRSVIAKGARPLVRVTPSEVSSKVTVLSASAGDQISNSYEAKGHGLFTYYLLKGLKGKGGDLRAAFDYLKPEVARTARREYNADQEPQWREGR